MDSGCNGLVGKRELPTVGDNFVGALGCYEYGDRRRPERSGILTFQLSI